MGRAARASVAIGVTATAVLWSAALSQPAGAGGDGGLTAAKNISRKYQSEQRALDHGYRRTSFCVSSDQGFMGYHYTDVEAIDERLVPGHPEVLLYKDGPDGTRVLTGIEYVVVDADQDLATDDDRPSIWGHPFDGPMPGHGGDMPIHYDLHVWAWQDNPAGAWTASNTDTTLRCP